MTGSPPDFRALAHDTHPALVALRRDLHAHPELGFAERRTAGKIQQWLGQLGNLKIASGVGGTGVVAVLNADRQGPCLALRADMDALPIEETSGLPYASTVSGCMHACGHDGHVACLLGAATVLSKLADQLPGCVKFLFQPAEEGGGGALKMVEAGALDDPKVDAAFALHGWPQEQLGRIAAVAGPVMAGTRAFDLTLVGTGTHAAYPHLGADVVAAAAQIVVSLQAIPARRTDPVEPLIISICQMSAGDTYNVLPETCRMKGTIRSLRAAVLDRTLHEVQRTAESIAAGFGATADLELREANPPVVNDPRCVALVQEVGRTLFGANAVVTDPPPSLGGEDFAYIARAVPGAFFQLGLQPPGGRACPSLHNPNYDFNDEAIPHGVAMHCGLAWEFLNRSVCSPCG